MERVSYFIILHNIRNISKRFTKGLKLTFMKESKKLIVNLRIRIITYLASFVFKLLLQKCSSKLTVINYHDVIVSTPYNWYNL